MAVGSGAVLPGADGAGLRESERGVVFPPGDDGVASVFQPVIELSSPSRYYKPLVSTKGIIRQSLKERDLP